MGSSEPQGIKGGPPPSPRSTYQGLWVMLMQALSPVSPAPNTPAHTPAVAQGHAATDAGAPLKQEHASSAVQEGRPTAAAGAEDSAGLGDPKAPTSSAPASNAPTPPHYLSSTRAAFLADAVQRVKRFLAAPPVQHSGVGESAPPLLHRPQQQQQQQQQGPDHSPAQPFYQQPVHHKQPLHRQQADHSLLASVAALHVWEKRVLSYTVCCEVRRVLSYAVCYKM